VDFPPIKEETEAEEKSDDQHDDEEAPPTGNQTTLLFDRHTRRRRRGAQLRRGWVRDAVRVLFTSTIAFITVIYVLPLILFAFRLPIAELKKIHAVGLVVVLGRYAFETFPLKIESALIITEVRPFVSAILGAVDNAITDSRVVDALTLLVAIKSVTVRAFPRAAPEFVGVAPAVTDSIFPPSGRSGRGGGGGA
jgi:hypothetical protein